jgi:2-oxo-3-hexenedioate decarboxylase
MGSSFVLDGPISAIRYLMDVLAGLPDDPPLAAGEMITTGTLTRAMAIAPGQTWTTQVRGVALDGIRLRTA